MPRRPRIEEAGFHHVINRGVARGDIFLDEADFLTFLDIMKTAKARYDFILHSFCLMHNHYHLLLQTRHENLSLLMRQINSKYAQYFNRRYTRVGPLWQGRFKNWYVYDDLYLYSLFRYIEHNPIEAKIVAGIGAYRWCASGFIIRNENETLLQDSQLYDANRFEQLYDTLQDDDREQIEKLHQTSYIRSESKPLRLKQQSLEEHFKGYANLSERNRSIFNALKDGYKQSEIAKYLHVTNAAVSHVVNHFTFDT